MLAMPSLDRLLDDLARLAGELMTPPAICGITLRQDHLPVTVASSGPLAAHLDEVQYGQDQGPCLQAMRTGNRVLVGDLRAESRWGSYTAHAVSYGALSCLSLSLTGDGDLFGAMNLYATVVDAFNDDSQQRAVLFAGQASAVLTVTLRQARHAQLTKQLQEALAAHHQTLRPGPRQPRPPRSPLPHRLRRRRLTQVHPAANAVSSFQQAGGSPLRRLTRACLVAVAVRHTVSSHEASAAVEAFRSSGVLIEEQRPRRECLGLAVLIAVPHADPPRCTASWAGSSSSAGTRSL